MDRLITEWPAFLASVQIPADDVGLVVFTSFRIEKKSLLDHPYKPAGRYSRTL